MLSYIYTVISYFSLYKTHSCTKLARAGKKIYMVQKFVMFALAFIVVMNCMNISFAADDLIMRLENVSSPNPVGSGARALGMGGAFIAVADDATAASWNPGGLIQLDYPEISLTGAVFHRIEDNMFGNHPKSNGNQTVSDDNINYLSVAYPFNLWDYNMIVSLNYQHLFDLNRQWNFPIKLENKISDLDYQQNGKLSAIGFAWCVRVNPRFSFGLTLNIWNNDLSKNEWEQKSVQQTSGFTGEYQRIRESLYTDKYVFKGINANVGFLWHINRSFTLGTVLKTPFEADLVYEHSFYSVSRIPELGIIDSSTNNEAVEDATMDMPMSYGIGLAYRHSDRFTASLDIYRTEWDDFLITKADGSTISPITGGPADETDTQPTHQVRMGIEYLFITPKYLIPLRGGIFYDPAPTVGNPDDFFGFSIGTGIGIKRFVFDIAYQYRFGNNVGSSILKEQDLSQDVEEHTVYTSVTIQF